MSEAQLWHTLRPWLKAYGSAERIENRVGLGTPDVIYALKTPNAIDGPWVTGLLELKHLAAWPKRAATNVTIPTLTLDQVIFAESWLGRYGLLLRVGSDLLLFNAGRVRDVYRKLPRAELEQIASWRSAYPPFPHRALVHALTA